MPLDDLLGQMKQEQDSQMELSNSAVQSYKVSPDAQAGAVKLYQQTGVPAHVFPEMTDDAKLQLLTDQMHRLPEEAPAAARFLSNPENAKVAHDDVNGLSTLEKIYAPLAGFAAKVMAGLASNEAVGTKAMNIISQGRRLLNENRDGAFQKGLEGMTAEQTQEVLNNVKYWDDIAAKYGQEDTVAGRIVGGLAKGLAGLPAGIVGFNPLFASADAAATSAQQGKDGVQTTGSALLEFAKVKGLMKIFHAVEGTGLGQMGKMGLTGAAMGTQTAAEIAGTNGIDKLGTTQGLEEIATSFVTGAAMGYSNISGEQEVVRKRLIAQGVDPAEAVKIAQAAPVLDPFVHELAAAREAKMTKDLFSALGDAASDTKLIDRLPEKMREYVADLKQEGPIENVYVPADQWQEYWQKVKEDPAAKAAEVTGDSSQFHEALATGGDVVIPLEDFVSKLAGSDHYKGLADDIKIRPGAMTVREAAAFEKEMPARIEELKSKIDANDAQQSADQVSYKKVYDQVYGQLKEIYPADTAEKYTTLAAVRARTRASRLGVNVLDLYNESPLRIVRAEEPPAAADGKTLNQSPRGSAEGQEAFSVRSSRQQGMLVPAVMRNGVTQAAGVGATHYDVHARIEAQASGGQTSMVGFVTPDGKMLDRKQSLEWIKENRPDVFARLDKTTQRNGLESQAYAHAEGVTTPNDSLADNFIKRQFGNSTYEKFYQDQAKKNLVRGFFRFSTDGSDREIGILEHADLSTFIHEGGHSWLEEIRQDAARPDAPEQLKEDWAILQKRLGIGENIEREQHEEFARSAEAYLMEGKAPSAELAGVFSRFKLWLTQIYRSMKGLNVNLTEEVRGVMDRLLATDEEIKRAQDNLQEPLFLTQDQSGMTPREFEAYKKDAAAAGAQARDTLAAQLVKELKREQEKTWKEQRDRIREEVFEEAKQDPVFTAMQEVLKGKSWDGEETPLKMDKAALVAAYGEDFVKRLPKGSATEYLYTTEGGILPDLLAERYGFSSGDEMIRKMVETPKLAKYLVTESDLRMKERHGDMLTDGTLADKALEAVHNDHWGEVLRAEIKALRRKAREVKPFTDAAKKDAKEQGAKDAAATARWDDAQTAFGEELDKAKRQDAMETIPPVATFREAAKQQIGMKRVAEISPQDHLNAERKASRKAIDLASKDDYRGAAEARTQQLLNHFLYFEAVKARDLSDKIQAYAQKMGKTQSLGKLGLAGDIYLEQMKAILSRYEFVKIPVAELEERKVSLEKFLEKLKNEDNLDLPIDPSIVDEMQKPPNYKDLTFDELRSVYDAIRMIEHAAKQVNKINVDGLKIQMDDAATKLILRLNSSIPDKGAKAATDSSLGFLERVKEHAGEIDLPVLRPEFIFERLDAGTRGVWHDFLWNRYNEASGHQNRLRELVFPHIEELARGKGIDRSMGKIEIKSLRGSLSKDDIIAVALNCGNEGNLAKMMEGGIRFPHSDHATQLTDQMLQEILGHLNPKEIEIVNGIWKAIGSLKPEAAALARRRTGIEPEWVEPIPMDVKNGRLEGGYYPLKGDPRYSKVGEKQSDSSTVEQMFRKFSAASTRQGYLKGRTEATYTLSLDWQSIVSRHLDEAITDISHWEFASTSQKLLKRSDIKEALIDRLGMNGYKNLLDWVKYTVNQDTMGSEASDTIDQLRRSVRTKASTYILGFKIQNAIADAMIGLPLAVQRLEATSVFRGSMEYLRNPREAARLAQASSEYMRHLDLEIDRDLTEALTVLGGKSTVMDDVRRWSIESRVWAYKIGATAAWLSGYREAQSKGIDGIEATRFADKVVRMTQDAGRAGDRSAVERNPNMKELTMYIGPTLIQYNNNAAAVRQMLDRGVNRATMSNAAKTFIFGYLANSVIYQMIRGRMPDEKEKIPAWLACKISLGMFEGIPIARDFAMELEGRILGEPWNGIRNIPVMEAGKALVDAGAKVGSAVFGEGDTRKAVTATSKAVGAWTGLPMMQGTITGEYLYDVLSGQYEPEHPWSPVTDIVNRRKKH